MKITMREQGLRGARLAGKASIPNLRMSRVRIAQWGGSERTAMTTPQGATVVLPASFKRTRVKADAKHARPDTSLRLRVKLIAQNASQGGGRMCLDKSVANLRKNAKQAHFPSASGYRIKQACAYVAGVKHRKSKFIALETYATLR